LSGCRVDAGRGGRLLGGRAGSAGGRPPLSLAAAAPAPPPGVAMATGVESGGERVFSSAAATQDFTSTPTLAGMRAAIN